MIGTYAKAVVAALIAGLTALQAVLANGTAITSVQWSAIAATAVSALGVLLIPNQPTVAPPCRQPDPPTAPLVLPSTTPDQTAI